MAYLNGQKVFLLYKTTENQKIPSIASGTVTSISVKELAGITIIRRYAFYGCYNLESVELPNTLTAIGGNAFENCDKLSSIIIPAAVQQIGEYAFEYSGLETVVFENGSSAGTGSSTDSQFYGCRKLTSVTLSNTMTKICNYMFDGCAKLPEIDIPASVTSIGSLAFYGCSLLSKVILRGNTAKTLSASSVFDWTPIASGNGYIYVDDSLVDTYKSATNWSTYASAIKGISELGD